MTNSIHNCAFQQKQKRLSTRKMKTFFTNGNRLLIWTFLFYYQSSGVVCQTSQDTKDLLTELFTTRAYNKIVRPVLNQSHSVEVFMDLTLVGLNDFNEINEKLTTTGWMYITWVDQFLTWTPASYGGITTIFVPQDYVWKPDIAVENIFSEIKNLGISSLLVEVSNDGTVIWWPFDIFKTTCDMDITYFPFDIQTCYLKFVAWSSSITEIVLKKGENGIDLFGTAGNGQWDIVSTTAADSTEILESSAEAKVTFSMTLQRKPLYHILNIILPTCMLSCLSLFAFVNPVESGEKIGFSTTVFLAFAVFLTVVTSTLPQNSVKVPIIGIWLLLQMVMSTVMLILVITQVRLYHKDPDTKVPRALSWIVTCMDVLKCRKRITKRTQVTPGEDDSVNRMSNDKYRNQTISFEDETEDLVDWKQLVSAMDVLFFWVFFIILIFSTFLLFGIAVTRTPV